MQNYIKKSIEQYTHKFLSKSQNLKVTNLFINMKGKNWRTGLMRSCFHHFKYLKLHWEVTFKTNCILKTQINDVSVKYIKLLPI